MHQAMAAALDRRSRASARSSRRARGGSDGAPALADDRAAQPQGLDRPEGRRRQEDRRVLARAPGADRRHANPEHLRCWKTGCAATARRSCSTTTGACGRHRRAGARRRRAHGRQSARQRRQLLRRCACPTSTPRRAVAQPGATTARRRGHGRFLRDVLAATPSTRNFRVVGPDETSVEPAAGGVRGHGRAWDAAPSPSDDAPRRRRPGDGDPQRAHLPGLAGRLPADRPARPVQLLRGVHPHRRLHGQPARQMAEDARRGAVAAADRVAELPADLACLAAGPQRVQPPGPGLHRPRRQQEAETVRVYLPPDANTLLWVTDHCLRTRNRINVIVAGKQPEPQWLTMDEAIRTATRASASGTGPATTRRRARRGDGLRRRRADAGGLAAVDLLRTHLPALKVRVVNVVDLMTLQPRPSTRTGCRTPTSTRCSPATSR